MSAYYKHKETLSTKPLFTEFSYNVFLLYFSMKAGSLEV
jgi:hypothetical protein